MNPLQQDHKGPGDNVGGNKIINNYPDKPTTIPRSKYLNTFARYDLANLVGRQVPIQAIASHLQDHHLLLLHGIGGIGKTTLAKAYIAQAQESYDHIAYVEMVGSIAESMLIQLGDSSVESLTLNPELDLEEKFERLISNLSHLPDLLLVLDNANEAEDLERRKKQLASLGAKVLITGRARPLVFAQERCILEIEALTSEEALELFCNYYTNPLNEAEQGVVKQLLQDAFYHPKLVEVIAKAAQANPFLSLEELAQLVGKKEYNDEEFNYPVKIDSQTKKIYRVLLDLFDPDALNEEAKELLRYFAILPTIDIPVQDLAAVLGLVSTSERQGLISGLASLVYGGWLEEVNNRYFSMHGLVQWVIRQKLVLTAENCRPLIVGMGSKLAYEPTEISLSRQVYLPYTTDWLEIFAQEQDEEIANTFSWIARIYKDLGDYRQALAYYQKDLAINETVLPADHPDLPLSYNNLAETYGDLGDHSQRLAYHQKALAIREAILPADHPDLARTYNNLAVTYGALGDHQLRLAFHQKALTIREAILPADHPDLALSYNNLAETYGDLDDHSQRLAYHQKALAINETVLPANHPNLALSYYNLAETYGDLGDHSQRLAYHQKALAINETVLPANHPNLALSYNNLAITYYDLNDLENAQIYMQKAVTIYQQILSADHPDLIASQNSLAYIEEVIRDRNK
jgi:tetratricopeptide (TPR) repeat protein